MAFFGYPRGHRVCKGLQRPEALSPTNPSILSLEPSRLGKSPSTTQVETALSGRFPQDGYMDGFVSFFESKHTPFFHKTKAMAAIFRAKVKRAIVGRIPLAIEFL
jgi:hypothetical protein